MVEYFVSVNEGLEWIAEDEMKTKFKELFRENELKYVPHSGFISFELKGHLPENFQDQLGCVETVFVNLYKDDTPGSLFKSDGTNNNGNNNNDNIENGKEEEKEKSKEYCFQKIKEAVGRIPIENWIKAFGAWDHMLNQPDEDNNNNNNSNNNTNNNNNKNEAKTATNTTNGTEEKNLDSNQEPVNIVNNNNTTLSTLNLPLQNPLINKLLSQNIIYRVSCQRKAPKNIHPFNSNEAASALGFSLSFFFPPSFSVSMTHYTLELFFLINSNSSYQIALCLTPRPNSSNSSSCASVHGRKKRRRKQLGMVSSLGKTSLSPLVCNSLVWIAKIQPGDIVFDPMCGVGSIPLHVQEQFGNKVWVIGGDIGEKELRKCVENVQGKVEWVRWDVGRMGVRNGIVDVVVSDLPFGVRSGKKRDNKELYSRLLREWGRVVREGGKVVMITADKEVMDECLSGENGKSWRVDKRCEFVMGWPTVIAST
eukprot:TRINITY_DN5276_c0_g1_i4.p1 TRINITY_DN5276_c0_g1~~TRINITY_DN5276_c0_g1_i4.p1  ORF type:complete len:480 (+),score=130.26 TRINITY_DN5276_c0_g1_i4:77-1516(+)